ncbi:MAG: two-component system, cell cycle sensor histidine kinase and response regulator CckA [Actinomycetota bacterium]|nr:two-component system, cell cycle sensor histidine kinase and response regulator CckA [Actinomycetota bacterium]
MRSIPRQAREVNLEQPVIVVNTPIVQPDLRILMIEDNPFDSLLIQQAIQAEGIVAGFRVVSDEVSLREALVEPIDVILTDYYMPELSFFDAIAMAKELAPGVPIIVVTGHVGDQAAAECMKHGAVDYVLKDGLARLPQAISTALDQQRLRTAANRAITEMEASETLRMAILESALDCVVGMDVDGRVIEFNAAAEKAFGYRREEVLGKYVVDLIMPERHKQAHRAGLKKYLETGHGPLMDIRREIEAVKADGTEFPIEILVTQVELPTGRVFTAAMRDISERKKMESQLRESEARFRSLVQNSRDVIAVIDVAGMCTYISPGVQDISGFTPEEIIGTSGFEFIHPDDIELVTAHLSEIGIASNATKTVEVRTRTKAGEWIWIEVRAANRADDPSIGGIVLNYHDITERRKAADRIATSERSLAEAQAISHFGSYSWDMLTDILTWSDEQYRLFGFEPGSIKPSYESVRGCIHPDDVDEANRKTRECMKSGSTLEMDFRVIQPDGTIRWIRARGEVAFEGGVPIRLVGTNQDVTGSKEAEEGRLTLERELRESERLFRGAFDAAQTGIALIGPDAVTYVDVNEALCEMLGYSKEELMHLNWLAITHPDDIERTNETVAEFVASSRENNRISKRYTRKDGGVIFVEIKDSCVRAVDGSPLYFVSHVTDVTEREEATAEKEILESRLRQGQKMEAVGQLAGGVAHDFNNILAVILNYAGFLREDLLPGDARLEDVVEIIKAGEKAAQLVHQLLAFSRQEIVEPRVIDLNEVVADLYELLHRSLGEDIELVYETMDKLPNVLADPGRIDQVLLNLAVNGRDAMVEGGVLTISAGTELVAENDRANLDAGLYVRLDVSDTGGGMEAGTAERVFEPFFTTKPRGEGTGLGLATVYGIVKQAHGGVYVESEVGVGTKFSVYLPAREDDVSESPKRPKSDGLGGTETILLVEDEDMVRGLVSRILMKHGYEVVAFSSGAEALEFFRENLSVIDLLLTDVVMPRMSGKSLSEKATALRADLRTLFMSGYTDELIAQKGVLDLRERLIRKPFNADQLLTEVRSMLDAHAPV